MTPAQVAEVWTLLDRVALKELEHADDVSTNFEFTRYVDRNRHTDGD